ncbi:MAG: CHAT domain-containing protein [Cyanobacteria bacterium J06626_26]
MSPAWGQITSTGATAITQNGTQLQVTGGISSADGTNLFHQFESFNVDAEETVTFIAPDSIENILGRVRGGQASIIDGGLAVSSHANLWLLNPAGLLFGPNAHLNLQGDFSAATANAIGFEQGWFTDGTDYHTLTGAPRSLAFISNPGYLINLGNLDVNSGQNLRLLGGSVINAGTLTAPAGTITVAAVPETKRVSLSQPGQLLALELEPWTETIPATEISPAGLPALLTGSGGDYADTLTVAADGTVRLTQAAVNGLPAAGHVAISGDVSSTGDHGGQIVILGEGVSLIDGTVKADGLNQGGHIYIGGNNQGEGPLPNATHTWVNQGTELSANALQQGNGGQIIVWANEATYFRGEAQVQGGELGGDGGFIEISGKSHLEFDGQFSLSAPEGESGTILFDPDNILIVSDGTPAEVATESLLFPNVTATDNDLGTLTLHAATLESWSGDDNIILQANGNIQLDLGGNSDLTFQPGTGSITFIANSDNILFDSFSMTGAGDLIKTSGRDITISGSFVTIESIDTRSATRTGDINLVAPVLATVEGSLDGENITVRSNELNLNGGNNSIRGTTLSIEPDNPATEISIGPNTNTLFDLDLLKTDILALQDGFTNISIGRSDGTGTITLYDATTDGGATPFQDPVTILGANSLRGPERLTPWTVTGTNQGNLDSLFNHGLRFENVSSVVVGNGTNDTIQGAAGNDTITFTGVDAGTFNGINFAGIQHVSGAGGDDRFVFGNGAVISGSIDGGTGTNTLDYSAYITDITFDLATETAPGTGSISNIQQVIAGSGTNTILGTSANDIVTLTDVGTGTLNNVGFQGFETVLPGGGDDRFVVNGGTWTNLDGGMGTDTLDYGASAAGVTIDLDNQMADSVATFTNIEDVRGSSGVDTLRGTNGDDAIAITANNTGTLNGTTFSGIETIDAGAGNDGVAISTTGSLDGNLEGGAGIDSLDYSTYTTDIVVNLGNNTATATGGLSNFEQITGGSGNNDSLSATGGNDDIMLTGTNIGTINAVAFDGFEHLDGQAGNDRIIINDGARVSGSVDGGTGTDSLDYANYTSAITIDLETATATGAHINNIETLIGGSASDTLTGTNNNDTFTITASDAGSINTLNFTGIENHGGGAGDDTFIFTNGASITGTLTGGTGIDTVDYSAYITDITIDLQDNIATGTGGFNTLESFIGGSGIADTFRLSAANPADFIEGGAGSNTLLGDDVASVWNLTAVDTGSGTGITNFSNIQNLLAGNQVDQINILTNEAGFTGDLDGSTGSLILRGDSINLGTAVAGAEELIIEPLSASWDIQLGGTITTPSALTLSTSELLNIYDGFTAITIGHSEGTGTITLGADITLLSPSTLLAPQGNGTINTQGFNLTAPELTLTAAQDITTATLTAANGITLKSGRAVSTQNILTADPVNGGNIVIDAATTITTQQLNTAGITDTGGSVTLNAADTIEVQSIRAEGAMAGGSVAITTDQFLKVTDSFTSLDSNIASISTAATNGTGNITIRHGGNSVTPFVIGDSSILGSHAMITSGDFQIPTGNSFINSHTLGNISLLTQDITQPLAPAPAITTTTPEIITPPTTIHQTINPSLPLLSNRIEPLDDSANGQDSRESNSALFERLESSFSDQFKSHLNLYERVSVSSTSLASAQQTLGKVEASTGVKPGVLYVYFLPPDTKDSALSNPNDLNPKDELGLLLLTHTGQAIRRKVEGVTRHEVMAVATDFYAQVTNSMSVSSQYLPSAQQLYNWFIRPVENELHQQGIESLALAMDTGLRTLPVAALHNGDEFLIERYSLGVIPSFSLTDFNSENFLYTEIENTQMLAMGASQFPSQQVLPAVPEELEIVADAFHKSEVFLDEQFTLNNLQTQVSRNKFGIVHLASHGVFEPGAPGNSYIQLWDQPLQLDQVHTLGLQDANIALMVLSACNTALGDREAEYGFAGLAVNAGVQTSVASLWPISDEGTLGLMTYFYEHLLQQPVRAIALRQSQLAMLQGELQIANGALYGPKEKVLAHFPDLEYHGRWDFKHPFYWSTYTLVGSPW